MCKRKSKYFESKLAGFFLKILINWNILSQSYYSYKSLLDTHRFLQFSPSKWEENQLTKNVCQCSHSRPCVFASNDNTVKKISPSVLIVKPMKIWITFLQSVKLHSFYIGVTERKFLHDVFNCYWFSFISLQKHSKAHKSVVLELKYIGLMNYFPCFSLNLPQIILDDS